MTPDAPPAAPLDAADSVGEYNEDSVQVLRDADHIRKRPDNYIPDRGARGLHHLAYELVYNAVDEALAGFCKHIQVTVQVDGTLSVSDDGRGIPVEMHPVEKRPTLEVVMTTVGAGGKFDNNAYKVSAGLHGMGAKAVTALSEWTEAQVRRDGKTYVQEYEKGRASTPVREVGRADHTGTRITFRPDPEIFGDATFDFGTLADRFRELAFLNRGLSIGLHDERDGREEKFLYQGGIAEYVAYQNAEETVAHLPIYIQKDVDKIRVEVAFQYNQSQGERVRAYANNAYNPQGGTHLSGFRTALTRTIGTYAEKNNLIKDIKPTGEDFRQGLTAVISVQLPNPQFEAQTKVRLNNPEVEGAVAGAVAEVLAKYLEENPKVAIGIVKRALLAAEEREAAAKAREAVRKRKNILSSGGLPGKLLDCTNKTGDTELFLVEGDSAGGTAESGRDRKYQAVLPLRGKPLNVEKARLETMLKNEEIISIISAIGIDVGNPDDLSRLRYTRIVILTDADVDGQHIRTLLLTFFFRQMRTLIETGHVFVARPPLYKVTHRKQTRFVQTGEELERDLMARGQDGTTLAVGEGDAPRELQGEGLGRLLAVVNEAEHALTTLERRGLPLANFAPLVTDAGLPAFRALVGPRQHWFTSAAEVEAFRVAESARLGKELIVAEDLAALSGAKKDNRYADDTPAPKPAADDDASLRFFKEELREVHALNRALVKLRDLGFGFGDLLPLPRVAGREPAVRYRLRNGDTDKPLPHLRDLVSEVRRVGERGWAITRFKGLGEMDARELWDTTLDPERRTMFQVSMTDALKAEEMFRKLMGDEIEGRRKYIFEHGIDLKDIDYGGG